MNYTSANYERDILNPDTPHIKSREHFINFYNELGKRQNQHNQTINGPKMEWVKPKGLILELGCHWGFNLIHWARQGFKCGGVEVSESLVEHGKKMIAKEPKEVRDRIGIVNSFIEDMAVVMKFDTIVLTDVLEYVIDPQIILNKASAFLKSDGLIYIESPAKRNGNFAHVRGVTEEDLNKWFVEAGLATEFSRGDPAITYLIAKKL